MTAPLGYGYEFEGAVELEPMLAGTDAPNGHSFRPRRSSVGLTGTLRAPSDSYAVPAWRPSSPPPPPGGPGESPSERGLVGFLRPARNRAASDFDRFGLLLLVDSDGDVDVEAENSEPAEGEPQVCGMTGTGGGAFEAPTGLPALSVACEGRERMKSYQMSELSQGSRSKVGRQRTSMSQILCARCIRSSLLTGPPGSTLSRLAAPLAAPLASPVPALESSYRARP